MMIRMLQVITILLALAFAAQGCLFPLHKDEPYQIPPRDGEHREYWAHAFSIPQQNPPSAKQSVEARYH
jgi:hypothetical protein